MIAAPFQVVHVPRRFTRTRWGGTETAVLETAKRMQGRGWAASIHTSSALDRPGEELISGVRTVRYDYFYPYLRLSAAAKSRMDESGGNLFSFALLRGLRRLPRLDLLHLHTANRMGGIVRRVAAERRIPYLITIHGGVTEVPAEESSRHGRADGRSVEWGRVLGWWVGSRRVYQDAAAILCVNENESRRMASMYPGKRVLYRPNGVDSRRFAVGDGAAFRSAHGIAPDAYVVLIVGRIDPQKNQLWAIRSMPGIMALHRNAHLVLVGHCTDAEYLASLKRETERMGLQDRVTWTGGVDPASATLTDAYHAADLFLLPSVHEPFGIVILEAWSAGLPVIAARVGGIPSFVRNAENGMLFDPGDENGCLSAFEALLKNAELAGAVAERGRLEAGSLYDWSVITQRMLDDYKDILREHSVR